jgi:DNA-binding MarR family transcriptional regulator
MSTDVPAVRRRMTSRELRIWRALLDTTADLRRILGAQVQESNLSPADYAVLLALSEVAGHEVRSTQLAAMMKWERSRLSHHLGRMERRGLIRRDECPTDNRGAMVSLTADGADVFRRASAPHLRAIKRHFADALTPRDSMRWPRSSTPSAATSTERADDHDARVSEARCVGRRARRLDPCKGGGRGRVSTSRSPLPATRRRSR